MRICIITGIFPPDIGGPATYVPLIAKALVERGHQVIVITFSTSLEHQDTTHTFRVVRVPRQMFFVKRFLLTLWTILRIGRQADILYVNGLHTEATLVNLLLRKPMVHKIVGDVAWERSRHRGWVTTDIDTFQHQKHNRTISYLAWLRAFTTAQADIVIVPSKYLASIVRGWGVKPERLQIIYNAIAPIAARQSVTPPLKTPFTLVTVSRLVPWKHIEGIIRAVDHFDDVGLVIIGEGEERSALENLVAARGLTERVYFAGQLAPRDVHPLMLTCDAFVLNSSYEGLPHIVLEAMLLERPVIATAVGGTPEVVTDDETGLLVPVGDDVALETAIRTLRNDPALRTRLARQAAHMIEQDWSIDAMVTKTEALLHEVKLAQT